MEWKKKADVTDKHQAERCLISACYCCSVHFFVELSCKKLENDVMF